MSIENRLSNGENPIERLIFKYLMSCEVVIEDKILIKSPLSTTDIHNLIRDVEYFYRISNPKEICMHWYTRAIRHKVKDIFTFLSKCNIKLGRSEWIVTSKDGSLLNEERMIELFHPMYTKKFISNYFGEWRLERIIKESEKQMGIF